MVRAELIVKLSSLVSVTEGVSVLVIRIRYLFPGGVLYGTFSVYSPELFAPMETAGIVPTTEDPRSTSIFTVGPGYPP